MKSNLTEIALERSLIYLLLFLVPWKLRVFLGYDSSELIVILFEADLFKV